MEKSYKIFVNYLEDNEIHLKFARSLKHIFGNCLGCDVFVSKDDLNPGDKIQLKISHKISNADYVLHLESDETFNLTGKRSQFKKQLSKAKDVATEFGFGDIFIIPIIIDGSSEIIFNKKSDVHYLKPLQMPYYDDSAIKKGIIELLTIMEMREPENNRETEKEVSSLMIPFK
jgi:hypothetical protein